MPTNRVIFLDVAFDALPTRALIGLLAAAEPQSPYAYLVTPNVDHLVRLKRQSHQIPGLAQAYRDADLCICDSRILSWLARWRGMELPVTPGSDLTELLFEKVIRRGDRIAIVGGDRQQRRYLQDRYPDVKFVQHEPPRDLIDNADARAEAAAWMVAQGARLIFLCVGSPQQELIAAEASRNDGARGMALCVGAALDFLTGRQRRAPMLVRRLGLEWAHRLLSDPGRLWKRYLVDGPRIFLMAARWPGKSASK